MPPVVKSSSMVVGGKLKFKGSKGSEKKSKSSEGGSKAMSSSVSDQKKEPSNSSISGDKKPVIFMTEAQRIHKEKRMATEEKELKKFIKTTHRDRIEMFNMRLGQMTEHNDIPRISAAGNG
jgi:protein FAM32A